ncbi:hypothetical protein [uncultured Mucilaginibacter sp.]|uniref:hypothetical protein n=1 Tax=uncultured Mucilaginibacter sp. TaxID=797541 RepID=UPI0025D70FB2|nr:hypothetical protein [uncultured Mucilaginibacter sp.]
MTQINKTTSGRDTAILLICQSNARDKLSVYTIAQEVVTSGTVYQLTGDGNNFTLHIRSIEQQQVDSLNLTFNDAIFKLTVNLTDRYFLFPDTYKRLKAMVGKHQLTALLNVLSDNIGNYPISDVLTFIRIRPQVSRHIRRAFITTKRNQSDLTDDWVCNYVYDRNGYLKQLKVSSGNVIRYAKSVKSVLQNAVAMSTYLNIEDRQITEQKITYFPSRPPSVKWQENVYEPGKDRTTKALISVSSKYLGSLQGVELPVDEVLRILKSK